MLATRHDYPGPNLYMSGLQSWHIPALSDSILQLCSNVHMMSVLYLGRAKTPSTHLDCCTESRCGVLAVSKPQVLWNAEVQFSLQSTLLLPSVLLLHFTGLLIPAWCFPDWLSLHV